MTVVAGRAATLGLLVLRGEARQGGLVVLVLLLESRSLLEGGTKAAFLGALGALDLNELYTTLRRFPADTGVGVVHSRRWCIGVAVSPWLGWCVPIG